MSTSVGERGACDASEHLVSAAVFDVFDVFLPVFVTPSAGGGKGWKEGNKRELSDGKFGGDHEGGRCQVSPVLQTVAGFGSMSSMISRLSSRLDESRAYWSRPPPPTLGTVITQGAGSLLPSEFTRQDKRDIVRWNPLPQPTTNSARVAAGVQVMHRTARLLSMGLQRGRVAACQEIRHALVATRTPPSTKLNTEHTVSSGRNAHRYEYHRNLGALAPIYSPNKAVRSSSGDASGGGGRVNGHTHELGLSAFASAFNFSWLCLQYRRLKTLGPRRKELSDDLGVRERNSLFHMHPAIPGV